MPRVGFAPFLKVQRQCWGALMDWKSRGVSRGPGVLRWMSLWGGLGGSAVLPDTTRCLSAFAQRLPRVLLGEGTAGAEKSPLLAAKNHRGGVLEKDGSAFCNFLGFLELVWL